MADIFDQLEDLRYDVEQAQDEVERNKDAIDEIQSEIDAEAERAEELAHKAWELLDQISEYDPAYDKAYAIWNDMEDMVSRMKDR